MIRTALIISTCVSIILLLLSVGLLLNRRHERSNFRDALSKRDAEIQVLQTDVKSLGDQLRGLGVEPVVTTTTEPPANSGGSKATTTESPPDTKKVAPPSQTNPSTTESPTIDKPLICVPVVGCI